MLRKGERVGPYTLLEKLGRGGFGVVWLAEKRTALTVTQVALKIPNDDDIELEAVRQEAALWVAASGHPNVLSIIDADIYDDLVVIVSEYAPDGSLEKWLKQHGGRASSTGEAVEMADGILAGLEHLHAKRIIHRDLKPANVLLQGRTPRLVDFGLARVLKSTSHSNTVSGTYAYMPPESFENKRSEQTDIWSAGVILYEMLAGTFPFPTDNDAALIGAILHQKPAPLPESVSPQLCAVVECALDKELASRYRSAAEMRSALRSVSGSLSSEINLSSTPSNQVRSTPNALAPFVAEPATPLAPEPFYPIAPEPVKPFIGDQPVPLPANEEIEPFPEDGDWWKQTEVLPSSLPATVSFESLPPPPAAIPRDPVGETVPSLSTEMLKNVRSGASVGKVVIGALLALGFAILVTWLVTQYLLN